MKFCSHPMEVKGDEIRITCDDDFLCHKLSGEIEEYFEGMMRKRFNRSVKICFNYVEKGKTHAETAGSIHGDPSKRTTGAER